MLCALFKVEVYDKKQCHNFEGPCLEQKIHEVT